MVQLGWWNGDAKNIEFPFDVAPEGSKKKIACRIEFFLGI